MKNCCAEPAPVIYVSGFADIVGGGQRSMLLLLKGLDRSRFRPLLICQRAGEVSAEAARAGIGTFFLEAPELKSRHCWKALPYMVRLRRLVRTNGARLIHCDTPSAALLCCLSQLFGGVPVVFHARVAATGGIYDRVLPLLCARIICVSGAVSRRFGGGAAGRKLRLVYNGVDTALFRPGMDGSAFRADHGIPAGAPLLGYCGQLVEEKGVGVLMDAFALVKKELPDARLVLAGRGGFEDEMRRRCAASGFGGDVVFAGFMADTPAFMSAIDALVLPSFWLEGLSRVLIEAMACGKPALATRAGGNAETIADGETGYFFGEGDAPDLAAKALRLLRDKALAAAMGAKARRRAEEVFSAGRTSRGVEAVYMELLEDK